MRNPILESGEIVQGKHGRALQVLGCLYTLAAWIAIILIVIIVITKLVS